MIGCGVLLVLLAVRVGACTVMFARSFDTGQRVIDASGGQIDGFHFATYNGSTTITFQAAQGVDASAGPRLACDVVRPTLVRIGAAGVGWVIVNRAGDPIASDTTPCP
jgi:hypothetical protein